jgi:hypothetical protein
MPCWWFHLLVRGRDRVRERCELAERVVRAVGAGIDYAKKTRIGAKTLLRKLRVVGHVVSISAVAYGVERCGVIMFADGSRCLV